MKTETICLLLMSTIITTVVVLEYAKKKPAKVVHVAPRPVGNHQVPVNSNFPGGLVLVR